MNTASAYRKLRELLDTSPESGLFLVVAGLAVAVSSTMKQQAAQPSAAMVLLLGALVASVGLPHGGLDAWLAQRSGLVRGAQQLLLFYIAYLLTAVAVAGFWLWQPGLALSGFLLYSAWHFAGDWPERAVPWRFLLGIALLALPAWMWPDAVASIFGALAGQEGRQLASLMNAAAPWLLLGMVGGLWRLRRHPLAIAELGVLIALALIVPPLVFFLVYYCTVHSLRSLRRILNGVSTAQRPRLLALAGLHAAIAALLVLTAGFFVMADGNNLQVWLAQLNASQGLSLVFIGLAALTVPHMLVEWLVARRGMVC
ncbi:Brp/Blh family beta-carotene 15,15'-dioxygenase [Thermus filiformis]|nr:Brp/Blh family beta-carotene 15,15'-dioxygenase [Thermus filiformis]